jgi:hypothetical protein
LVPRITVIGSGQARLPSLDIGKEEEYTLVSGFVVGTPRLQMIGTSQPGNRGGEEIGSC